MSRKDGWSSFASRWIDAALVFDFRVFQRNDHIFWQGFFRTHLGAHFTVSKEPLSARALETSSGVLTSSIRAASMRSLINYNVDSKVHTVPSSHSSISLHDFPSPLYPSLQVQLTLPPWMLHSAFLWQVSVSQVVLSSLIGFNIYRTNAFLGIIKWSRY